MLKVMFSLHQLCQLHSGSQKAPILYKVFSDNGFYFHRIKSMLVTCSDDPQANGVFYTREVVEFKLARTNWISCQNPSQYVQGAHTQQSLWERGSHLGYLGSYVLRWSKGLYAQFTPSESARLTHNQWRTKSERRGWNIPFPALSGYPFSQGWGICPHECPEDPSPISSFIFLPLLTPQGS